MPKPIKTAPKSDPAELARLRDENEQLRARLDRIAEIAGGDGALDDEEDEDDLDDEDEEEDEEEEEESK